MIFQNNSGNEIPDTFPVMLYVYINRVYVGLFIFHAREFFQYASTAESGSCSEINDYGLNDWGSNLDILAKGRVFP
jgi:hypothetical protein